MKKLIFLDIDGTIAMPGTPPSPATVDAIRQARRNGHWVFLSTGRALCNIDPAIAAIGFDGGIYHAGGRVLLGDQMIVDIPLTQPRLQELLTHLTELDMTFHLEAASSQYSSWAEWSEFDSIQTGSTELLRQVLQRRRANSKPLPEYQGEPVYKIAIMSRSKEQRTRLRNRLPSWAKLVWFDELLPDVPVTAGEVSDGAVSKATAMAELCRRLHANADDCIAFGDSMNDAEILAAAGIGVAMGNSDAQIKQIADRVCESCAEDGIAKEFQRLKLI